MRPSAWSRRADSERVMVCLSARNGNEEGRCGASDVFLEYNNQIHALLRQSGSGIRRGSVCPLTGAFDRRKGSSRDDSAFPATVPSSCGIAKRLESRTGASDSPGRFGLRACWSDGSLFVAGSGRCLFRRLRRGEIRPSFDRDGIKESATARFGYWDGRLAKGRRSGCSQTSRSVRPWCLSTLQ
jgi:hypothetical protein